MIFVSSQGSGTGWLLDIILQEVLGDSKIQFLNFFQKAFRTRDVLRMLIHTLIVLIFKVNHAANTDHFRPISLCNFNYKVIAKILAF